MSWSAIDLSNLPLPAIVEELIYEKILAEMLAELVQRDPTQTALLESDPSYKILEVASYREMLLRQRVNEAIKAVMLAYAKGKDLDQIAANYNVERLTLVEADPDTIPPTQAVMEDDEDLRRRAQLAFEGMSTAGPEGAYIFHALSAHADVLDASVDAPRFSHTVLPPELRKQLPEGVIILQVDYDAGLIDPMPGMVAINVLDRNGDGTPTEPVLSAVNSALSAKDVRPLTDHVITRAAEILHYDIKAQLVMYPGPDSEIVRESSEKAVSTYAEKNHRMGRDITLSGLYSALHQEGVQNVILDSPVADIVATANQATYCTEITVTIEGSNV